MELSAPRSAPCTRARLLDALWRLDDRPLRSLALDKLQVG
jgi:hypothetical protein